MSVVRRLGLAFVIALGLALGATSSSVAQGPVILRSSGGTEIGTSAAPLRIDPTGSTTQPTNVAQIGGSSPASTNPLPVRLSDGTSFVTPSTDATTNTTAQTAGPQLFVIGSSSAPTAVTTGNSVGLWGDLNGRAHVTGDASMTALKMDGSAVTQPVSGTFWQATQPVSATSLPLPTGAATETTLGGVLTTSDFDTKTGSLTETAPATDTASSGLNGRLQRIAQRITSLITAIGSPFQAGGSIGNTTFGATQSGTWTVQPGNTANTTAWKVDGSAVTQPVSAAVGAPVFVTATPSTTGGWSVNSQTALTNTKVAVKASAGTFGGYMVYNPNASVVFVQVFDVASASVTLGMTAPTYVIPIPPSSGANLEITLGINHATAITLAATTTATGPTAPGTALNAFFLFK